MKASSQPSTGQRKGRSLVCVRIWSNRLCHFLKSLLQRSRWWSPGSSSWQTKTQSTRSVALLRNLTRAKLRDDGTLAWHLSFLKSSCDPCFALNRVSRSRPRLALTTEKISSSLRLLIISLVSSSGEVDRDRTWSLCLRPSLY